MSEPDGRSPDAATEVDAYVSSLLEALASRDPLEVLAATTRMSGPSRPLVGLGESP